MDLKRQEYDKLVEITKRNAPNEACAYLFDNNTLIVESFPSKRSPAHFNSIDPETVQSLIAVHGVPSALFHSHPGGNTPSHRDEQYMTATMKIWYCIWLIMSSSYGLKAYIMCPEDTRSFGRLVYKHEEVNIVD